MIETKPIKVTKVVYDKMKERMRFNESFGDFIARMIETNDLLWINVRGLYSTLQTMRKHD